MGAGVSRWGTSFAAYGVTTDSATILACATLISSSCAGVAAIISATRSGRTHETVNKVQADMTAIRDTSADVKAATLHTNEAVDMLLNGRATGTEHHE